MVRDGVGVEACYKLNKQSITPCTKFALLCQSLASNPYTINIKMISNLLLIETQISNLKIQTPKGPEVPNGKKLF